MQKTKQNIYKFNHFRKVRHLTKRSFTSQVIRNKFLVYSYILLLAVLYILVHSLANLKTEIKLTEECTTVCENASVNTLVQTCL